ncbi:transcription factor [Trichoderma cornu-damae]|uniref:Transcription factor n=1 Tax=Trichoderma cornu-damae TaxID=654480 RepID=A0A9P8QPR8_9HYPO|nr:transcription factor [Trichoderma cornu-damae]
MEEPLLLGDFVRTSQVPSVCEAEPLLMKVGHLQLCFAAVSDAVVASRPVSKNHVQALEGQIAALERVTHKLALADEAERNQIISDLSPTSGAPGVGANAAGMDSLAISTDGQQHYKDSLNTNHNNNKNKNNKNNKNNNEDLGDLYAELDDFSSRSAAFQYEPHHEASQKLMSTFFSEIYPYNMVVYCEHFPRDYDIGSGKYYSDVLLYAICALAALQHDDMLSLSDVFSGQAQTRPIGMDPQNIERALSLITMAMGEIRNTWPCVREIRDVLLQAQQTQATMLPEDSLDAPDLTNGLEMSHDGFLENLEGDIAPCTALFSTSYETSIMVPPLFIIAQHTRRNRSSL